MRSLAGGGHIDAHVHVWTPDTEKYPLASGYKKADMQPASFTPEQLFAHCKPEGVTRIVLDSLTPYPVSLDRTIAPSSYRAWLTLSAVPR